MIWTMAPGATGLCGRRYDGGPAVHCRCACIARAFILEKLLAVYRRRPSVKQYSHMLSIEKRNTVPGCDY